MKAIVLILLAAASLARAETPAPRSPASELSVAREALRDGLWEIARTHARRTAAPEGTLVVLESYAAENRWDDVKRELARCPNAKGPAYEYYRAVVDGNLRRASTLLKESASSIGASRALMLEASVCLKGGDRAGAEMLWRQVIAMTNADMAAYAIAAANIGDVSALRRAAAEVPSPNLRRLSALRLGMRLVSAAKTFDEGEKLVRALVKDSPDGELASEAFLAVADAHLAAGRWRAAGEMYRDAIEVWPAVAKTSAVRLGSGVALLRQGHRNEALEAFRRAEALAQTDEDKALALLRQGDALTELGRAEEGMACYRRVLEAHAKTQVATILKTQVGLRAREAEGRRLYRQFLFDQAREAFRDVAKADSSRKPRMDYYVMLCLYGRGDEEQAARLAEGLCSSSDETVRAKAQLWLAKYAYNRGQWKKAISLFVSYVDDFPKSSEVSSALTWATRAALAEKDFAYAIQLVTRLVSATEGDSPAKYAALVMQAEALIELARFDEAVLVLENIIASSQTTRSDRTRAQLLKADALFALGADNSERYRAALALYAELVQGGHLDASALLVTSFKVARTLEKLKRTDEALDQYYTGVVLAYREGRARHERYDDEARAAFSRAGFRLADAYEGGGKVEQAANVLKLVAQSDVPAAREAEKRRARLLEKGRFL